MSWHVRPEDDAWTHATLARSDNDKIWLQCGGCRRSYTVMLDEFVAHHRLDPKTPFLIVAERLRCVWCGARKGYCRSEVYGIDATTVYPVVGSPQEGPQPERRILQPEWEPPRLTWPDLPEGEEIDF